MNLVLKPATLWLAAFLASLALTGTVVAERPPAPKLLPEKTLAYVRIADTRELVKRFQETSTGRMGQDDQIRPLVSSLYGSVTEAFAQIEEEVGLPLEKILALPQGEVCFAVTTPDAGPPAMLLLFEAGDQMPSVQKLLDRGVELAEREGAVKSTEVLGDVKLTIYEFDGNAQRRVAYFQRDGMLVVGSNVEQIKLLLDLWNGTAKEDVTTLADNREFTTIMNRSGSQDDPPQITFFVDPISFAKVAGRGDFQTQAGLALLPAIGLDGLKAVGGSVTMATEDFDSVMHLHVLLDEPRSGVLDAIAVTSGDLTPEPWVPADVASYMTINFDAEESYKAIAKLFNSFRGDDALQGLVERRINERLEVDFEADLLGQTAGRFTYLTFIEKPIKIDSQRTLVGVKLKDSKAFQETLEKIVAKYEDRFEKTSFGVTPYWRIKTRRTEPQRLPGDAEGFEVRPPQPCFAILGDYFVFCDRTTGLDHAIATSSDAGKSLAKDLEFKLIMSKIQRQPGGDTPGMISFSRPEEGMRMLYELVQAEGTKKLLAAQAERSDFFKNIDKNLKDNPLPPFGVISQYLAPAGGFLVNDETGFHYAAFQLRRK